MEAGKKLKLGGIMHAKTVQDDTTQQAELQQEANVQTHTTIPTPIVETPNVEKTEKSLEQHDMGGVQEIKSSDSIDSGHNEVPAIGIHKNEEEKIDIENSDTKNMTDDEKEEVFKSYSPDLYQSEDEALQKEELKKHPVEKKEPEQEENHDIREEKNNTNAQKNEIKEMQPTEMEMKEQIGKMDENVKINEKKEKENTLKQKKEEKEAKKAEKKEKKPKSKAMKFMLTSFIALASIAVIIGGVFFINTGSDVIENYKASILDMVNKNTSDEDKNNIDTLTEDIEEVEEFTDTGTTQDWTIENIVFGRNDSEVKVYNNNGEPEFEYDGKRYTSKETVYNVIRITVIKNTILDYFKILK